MRDAARSRHAQCYDCNPECVLCERADACAAQQEAALEHEIVESRGVQGRRVVLESGC